MTRASREDMVLLHMGVNTLLACVRQTESWWRNQGDAAALRRARLLTHAILTTRRKFFADHDETGDEVTEASSSLTVFATRLSNVTKVRRLSTND